MTMDAPAIPARLTDEPEFANELDEAILAGTLAEVEPAQAWQPTTLGEAEWAMRKLAALKGRAAEAAIAARDWRGRIDEWERAELARVAPGIAFFEGRLKLYGLAQRTLTKQATATLPSGYVSTTVAKTPTIEVDDEDAVLVWAADTLEAEPYDEVVKTKLSVLISALRKLVSARPTMRPVCHECGRDIVEAVVEGNWEHLDEASVEDDHAAEPTPGYVVVYDETGEVVPGLVAFLKGSTASVTVAR